MKTLNTAGKIAVAVVIIGLLVGAKFTYDYFFPRLAKKSEGSTKATNLPPLAYDKGSNAPFRELPELDEPADVQGPEVRLLPFGWNGWSAANYSIGGRQTSKGSICEEMGLNIKQSVNNSMTEQFNQLYAGADGLKNGDLNKGVHGIIIMADAWANYASGWNDRLRKDFGEEYTSQIVYFTGASFGEDKWMVKKKYLKDARGSVTATVVRDGDWNIMKAKCDLMGWQLNNDIGTYDATKVNVVAAPNDDYTEAGKMYISGQKVTLKLIKNGKITSEDTTLAVTGVASWFPVDHQLAEKGGLVTLASTKDFASQMACGLIVIKKWAQDNKETLVKMIEAFGRGGDQIKSHDEALKFASQVNEIVFADKTKDAEAWYNAYKSFDVSNDDGDVINVGGSRAFSLADAAHYTGVDGSGDTYKKIYNMFGQVAHEAFPEIIASVPPYEEVTDWTYLKAAYNKAKGEGTAGSVSKTDFSSSSKGAMIGNAPIYLNFGNGSAEINPADYSVLEKVADQLANASNAFVEIVGHTNSVGSPESNLALSKARAKAVANYLKKLDSDLSESGKLRDKGMGQQSPLSGTEPADPRNRRVEIKLYRTE